MRGGGCEILKFTHNSLIHRDTQISETLRFTHTSSAFTFTKLNRYARSDGVACSADRDDGIIGKFPGMTGSNGETSSADRELGNVYVFSLLLRFPLATMLMFCTIIRKRDHKKFLNFLPAVAIISLTR